MKVAMTDSGRPPFSTNPLIVAVSDFRDGWPPASAPAPSVEEAERAWRNGVRGPSSVEAAAPDPASVEPVGGYLERLPLACVRAGLAERAEIWSWWRPESPPPFARASPALARRGFRLQDETPPFGSADALGFVRTFGSPRILCAWGLGVDAALLDACEASFRIYDSIDHPALRVPPAVSARFDLILTAAEWQSEAVRVLHPDMPVEVMPIGPEFADPLSFRPLGTETRYDVIYVAAAQPYKRHDLLFDALARAPRRLSALCVFGYGELADDLRREAAARGLDVDFVGPPGVAFAEVNRLMNLARVGVVCGEADGAPAILTEYMLAGLPVLANARLSCGLQFITPDTGAPASPDRFHEGLIDLLGRAEGLRPRETVLARWTWPHTVERLKLAIARTEKGRALLGA